MKAPYRPLPSLCQTLALAAACTVLPGHAVAAAPTDPAEDPYMAEIGYMELHPDVEYRQSGQQAYKRGRLATALQRFRRAGYFGDKPSQSLVAQMYWKGEGAPADRALAYVWMDLAAERGYRDLVGLRERYWAAMTPAERERALQQGPALYRTYGDAAAKPRYAQRLTRLRNQITGSHLGMDVGIAVSQGRDGVYQESNKVGVFYARTHWDPQLYWAAQDRTWRQHFGGTVNVGGIQALGQGEPGAAPAAAPEPAQSPEPKP
ncbi:hypothetical protein [Lysobacter sp. CA199]|uniref:hypothetical protein n=1 Tax=Lysobacter sp. CA199 TaxID=3455608 RepID=UPI003F8D813A